MDNRLKTFCPGKWDDLFVNLNYNFAYACCKGVPVKFVNKKEIETIFDEQKNNLLNGIQDPNCNYCWQLENQGFASRRNEYLEKFDINRIDEYQNTNPRAKFVEINLGNECNFQCIYCNPKFSSQWEIDVRNKPYKIFSDRHFYDVDVKEKEILPGAIEWLKNYNNIEVLAILGGEPLQNKNFFKLVNSVSSRNLSFVTNLSCKTHAPIDKILELADRYETVEMGVSLDCTSNLAEFIRYGLDYNKLISNLHYLLENAPSNFKISINSVMTSLSIRNIQEFVNVVDELRSYRSSLLWIIEYCRDPKILTLDTLHDTYKEDIVKCIENYQNEEWIIGMNMLKGAVSTSKFNNTLYQQLKNFLEQFSERKNICIPINLE